MESMPGHDGGSTAEIPLGGNTTVTVPTIDTTVTGRCNQQNMLWNWDTIDTCLISKSWHIRSHGMFAGACIAIFTLTISLQFFRRVAKEYDKHMIREHEEGLEAVIASAANSTSGSPTRAEARDKRHTMTEFGVRRNSDDQPTKERFRPSFQQQIIRGLLHTIQFTVAYFIMLTAMYFNGYFLLCIFAGAYIGFMAFEWEGIDISIPKKQRKEPPMIVGAKSFHSPPVSNQPRIGQQI